MSTITLQNFRVGSDLTVKVRLKDGGVAIDWSTLSGIRAVLYSDAQSSVAGRCDVTVDGEDPTILVCRYAATKMQYLGVNRIIVSAKFMGMTKTYDKPVLTFVRWTEDQQGEEITVEDPEVTVEIDVEDISSSILQEAVDAAFSAADRANEAAEAAEHMVDIHTGPEGKSAYEVAVENGYTGTEEEWLASLKGPVGETPDISIGTVTTVEPGTPAAASMGGTPEAPVLNLSIPKGAVGATPNFTVGTVTTGQPGTPVVITITGTAEAPVLNVTIPQGLKGDTGVSADYPITIHNGLDSDATDEALAAAQGKILDDKVSQLEHKVDDIEDQLVVTDSLPVAYEYIDNIYVSSSSIAKQNGRRLFYVPVVANTIVKASWSFTNAYVRCGFSTTIPANGVSVDKSVITVGGTGTGTKGATCSPSVNGYFCVSFDDPSSIQSLAFFKPTSGIGKEVKNLQDDLLNLVAFDGYVEGNDDTSVTTTIPLPVGRYKMTIRDFVRGMDNRSYIIFRIKVGSRTICEYMGQELVPDTFYFDVLSGETSAVILSRSVSGKSYAVRITASEQDGIFDFNPIGEQIDRLMNAKKELKTDVSPFVLLHFTDIHGNSENLTRVLQYYDTLRYRIDDIIHTGDAVANTVTATSFDFWDDCGAEKVLNCIGNHDVWVTDDYTPPANFDYDLYFKPYIDNADWGAVVQPSDAEANGKCYYYKDYSNGIRLVVLDYREPAGQIEWFEQVLADAVTNELSVVAAVHYVPGWTAGYHNSFDISQFVNIVLNLSTGLVNAVDTFIGNGGKFVCWLTGHTHRDNAGYYQGTNGKQVVINLDTASVRNDGNTRYRAYNSKSQDCFNIVAVNTGAKLLSIFRVGNDIDALQRHIGTMCIKYDTGDLVWTN